MASASLEEILVKVKIFLWGQRNVYLDGRDYLSIKQEEGEFYSSLQNRLERAAALTEEHKVILEIFNRAVLVAAIKDQNLAFLQSGPLELRQGCQVP